MSEIGRELERLRRDSQRWATLRKLFVGADFCWGEPAISVAVFQIPPGVRIGTDLDAFADECAGRVPRTSEVSPENEPQ